LSDRQVCKAGRAFASVRHSTDAFVEFNNDRVTDDLIPAIQPEATDGSVALLDETHTGFL
jgi:hypothetical protein